MRYLLIFYYSFTILVNGFEQRSDCVESCSHLDTSQEFGDCLTRCSKRPRKDNLGEMGVFAQPPKDVDVKTNVVMDEGKILETTIYWNADDNDNRRTGFYIRYTAINSTCQKHFPGFFASSIPKTDRSFTIPAAFNGHPLIIDHSCSYQLQLRSIPYPAGDDNYIIEKRHTVPDCIDDYCSCKDGDVADITTVGVHEEDGGYVLSWGFVENSEKKREYMFHIDVYERILMSFKPKSDEDGFTFRIANLEPYVVSGKIGVDHKYSYRIPFQFVESQQYKISIFAVDDNFCHNEDSYLVFNTSMTPVVNTTVMGVVTKKSNDPVGQGFLVDYAILIVCFAFVGCVSPFVAGCWYCLYKRNRKEKKKRSHFLHRRSLSCSRHSIIETNILYRRPNEVNGNVTDWQIRGQDVVIGTVIGEGAFGQVFKGILRTPGGQVLPVAVKQLKANAIDEEREEFVREIQMMQTVGQHENIVAMYGYCMDDNLECMIMEYVPYGDLKHYLQNMKKREDQLDGIIDPVEFQSFATQIANGMSHLESLGIIHRDLAARNILVGTGKILKISDFGMSRPGVYIKMSKGVIPLRWLSPEAIKDNVYSTKSDVWAFGVLLWEIATLGGFPYAEIGDQDILSQLTKEYRLEKPAKCSDELYNLMKSCWQLNPDNRPTFVTIVHQLGKIIEADTPPSDPPAKTYISPV